MKSFKRILALALIVLMTVSLAACGKSPEQQLIGKWNIDLASVYEMMGVPADQIELYASLLGDISATMEFTKDGKIIMVSTAMGETTTEENTYTVEGNKIIVDGEPAEFKIEKNTLTITESGLTMVMKKAK